MKNQVTHTRFLWNLKNLKNQCVKLNGFLLLPLIVLFLYSSCKKKDDFTDNNSAPNLTTISTDALDSYFVNENYANYIAQRLPNDYIETGNSNGFLSNNQLRSIKSIFKIILENETKEAAYFINYSDGGYAVISADLRHSPILAMGNKGSITYNDSIIEPIYEWLINQATIVSEIRNNDLPKELDSLKINIDHMNASFNEWKYIFSKLDDIDNQGFDKIPGRDKNEIVRPDRWDYFPHLAGDKNNCLELKKHVGPLIKTLWHLDYPYNNEMPYLGNSGCGYAAPNWGKAPVGSEAVALAQLLKYHNKPHANYNYATMPNYHNNNNNILNIQYLMRDVASYLGSNYTCTKTYQDPGKIHNVLNNVFGYTGPGVFGAYTTTSKHEVMAELDVNRVVVLNGYSKEERTYKIKFLFIKIGPKTTYEEGHTWLCDGYNYTRYSNCTERIFFHHNWGLSEGILSSQLLETDWVYNKTKNYQFNKRFYKYIFPY